MRLKSVAGRISVHDNLEDDKEQSNQGRGIVLQNDANTAERFSPRCFIGSYFPQGLPRHSSGAPVSASRRPLSLGGSSGSACA